VRDLKYGWLVVFTGMLMFTFLQMSDFIITDYAVNTDGRFSEANPIMELFIPFTYFALFFKTISTIFIAVFCWGLYRYGFVLLSNVVIWLSVGFYIQLMASNVRLLLLLIYF